MLLALTLTSCENNIKKSPKEIDYSTTEVYTYIDPDTNVEYLVFSFTHPVVVPRYNTDGSIKCLD